MGETRTCAQAMSIHTTRQSERFAVHYNFRLYKKIFLFIGNGLLHVLPVDIKNNKNTTKLKLQKNYLKTLLHRPQISKSIIKPQAIS